MGKKSLITLLVCLGAWAGELPAREWSDASGQFKIQAEYVSFSDGTVYLKKSTGEVINVPIAKLSDSDRSYLRHRTPVLEYFQKHPELDPGGEEFATIVPQPGLKDGEVRRFREMPWTVKSLAFSGDGALLALGKIDSVVMLIDIAQSHALAKLEHLSSLGTINCVQLSPDRTKLIAGGSTGKIFVWDIDEKGNLSQATTFSGHTRGVNSIVVSPNGQHVLSGGLDKKMCYWQLADGKLVHEMNTFKYPVKACFITPSGEQALGSDGDELQLFELSTGEAVQKMDLDSRSAQGIAISPDGRKIAAAHSYDIRVWDTITGEARVLPDSEVQWNVAFSPDGKRLIAGGRGKVNLWDVEKKRKIKEYPMFSDVLYVQTLAFSPDNKHFAAIGSASSQKLQVFAVPPPE